MFPKQKDNKQLTMFPKQKDNKLADFTFILYVSCRLKILNFSTRALNQK